MMITILILVLYILAGVMYLLLSANQLQHRITNVIQAVAVIFIWPYFFLKEYFNIFR